MVTPQNNDKPALKVVPPYTDVNWGSVDPALPGVGDELDSSHAFVVRYGRGFDVELAPHRDDAEVTFNVALSTRSRGCQLVFCGRMQDGDVYQHRLSHSFPGVSERSNFFLDLPFSIFSLRFAFGPGLFVDVPSGKPGKSKSTT